MIAIFAKGRFINKKVKEILRKKVPK